MAVKLKYLVIENFKTYKGKHVVGPLHPFTALVGPNGGGKSNLMDAVAFVLGEKVAALRVQKAADLIHRSTASAAKKTPVTASVSAIFVLNDGGEKEFKRVVAKNGSEYLVEGEIVSYNDYHEGLKELSVNIHCRNFMVFQGSVESIAISDNLHKTKLFEEISRSGIYKNDYNALKKKLAKAEEELVSEKEKRVTLMAHYKELREDSMKTKKYEEMEKICEKRKLTLQLFRLYHSSNEQKGLEEDVTNKEKDFNQLKEKERKKAQIVQEKLENKSFAIQASTTIEHNVGELEMELRKKRSELINIKEFIMERKKKEAECKRRLSEMKATEEDYKRKVDELENLLKLVEKKEVEYENQLSEEAKQMGTSVELEGEKLQQYNQLKQQANQCSYPLQEKVDKLSRKLKTELDKLANEDRQLEEGEETLKRKERELEEAKKRMKKLTECLKGMVQSSVDKQQKLEELKERVSSKKSKVVTLNKQLESLQNQLNEATWDISQVKRHREKQELVEILRELFPGVRGRFINLCKPIHERYELAVTRVLIKHLDSIVVDTEATARRCIKYLCDKKIGRETFLALNYLQPLPLKERLRTLEDPQQVRLAFDLIQCESPDMKVALLFVCTDTLVCETSEDAMRVAFEMKLARAVSLDGTQYTKSGLITGGKMLLKDKAKCWTEKNVANMKVTRNKMVEELREAQKVTREEAEMNVLETQVEGQRSKVKYTSLEIDQIRKQIEEVEKQQKKLEEEQKASHERHKAIKVAVMKQEEEIKKIREEIDKVENEIFSDFCRDIGVPNIQVFKQQGLQVLVERSEKKLNFEKQKSRILSLIQYEKSRDIEADVKKWMQLVKTQAEELEKIKEREKKKIGEVELAIRNVAEVRSKLEEREKAVRDAEEEVEAAQEQSRLVRKEKEKMQNRIFRIIHKIAGVKLNRHNILKQCHIKGVKLPLASGPSLQQMVERSGVHLYTSSSVGSSEGQASTDQSHEEINIRFSSLKNKYKRVETEEQKKMMEEEIIASISYLEKSISEMQPPVRVSEEYMIDVQQQQRDMTAALRERQEETIAIKEAFEDVKKKRLGCFMKCFTSVATNIDRHYKGLCNSNSAQALLETDNSEEPYLGSIVYHCIPPGKRFQNMMNLSGGEKAMASLAFLFALHNYHPAPFFILDEVDAALDKVNIYKTASYLNHYKDEVQILVISHKEELYHKADVLFGVTCRTANEYGESKLYSVNLKQSRQKKRKSRSRHQQHLSSTTTHQVETSA